MFNKRKRKYHYRRRRQWPRSNRYRYAVPMKYHLIRLGIILLIVLVMFLMVKRKDKEVTYNPMQEWIAAFEVPPQVSSRIFEEAKNNNKDVASLFATYIIEKEKGKDDEKILNNISRYKPGFFASSKSKKIYKEAVECYQQFILDLEAFPIPQDYEYTFENSWYAERTYGGSRKHYGTDIMDPQNQRGVIPIVSMSQGVVENIGWNETGGYRVGVRSKNGAYLYYAHLDKYAPEIKKGSLLETGDLIGYMGDSGYGKEGTTGEFPVHLHIGIATKAFGSKEAWINPHYLLRYLEEKDMEILKSRGIF